MHACMFFYLFLDLEKRIIRSAAYFSFRTNYTVMQSYILGLAIREDAK